MTESNHLCDLWEHTIVKIFKHDSESELGLMFKQWIIFNKLENFNSIVGSCRRKIEIFLILLLVMSLNKKKIVEIFLISKNNLTYIIKIRAPK